MGAAWFIMDPKTVISMMHAHFLVYQLTRRFSSMCLMNFLTWKSSIAAFCFSICLYRDALASAFAGATKLLLVLWKTLSRLGSSIWPDISCLRSHLVSRPKCSRFLAWHLPKLWSVDFAQCPQMTVVVPKIEDSACSHSVYPTTPSAYHQNHAWNSSHPSASYSCSTS